MSNSAAPTNESTRREFFGLVAAAGLIVAGCGGGDDEGSAGGTRTFVDISGEPIEVPDRAERIVATNDQNAGAQLLSLGAPVVGIASSRRCARPVDGALLRRRRDHAGRRALRSQHRERSPR